jgi:predicted acyl esterase
MLKMAVTGRVPLAVGLLAGWLLLGATAAPAPALLKESLRVPMRDGVPLGTDVYRPEGPGAYPVVLVRTPYNKAALAGVGADGVKRGYAVVAQDTRGRFASAGENMPFEADGWDRYWDGYDTVQWLRQQGWCNGKIGTWGGSAVGITQLFLAGTGTADVTCQHITVGAPSLYFDAVYPGGVFKKAMIEDWLRVSNFSTNALILWTSHPLHDAYWHERELNQRYRQVNAPAVHIGGWFDIFAQGTLDGFSGYQLRGGPRARGHQKLVMGPWTHGVLQDKAGDLKFPNAKRPPSEVHDPWGWFDYQLKGLTNALAAAPAVTYYVLGDVTDTNAPGNVWRTASQWPPVATRQTSFYFGSDRTLSSVSSGAAEPLNYTYNPTNPVPTVGGPQLTLPAGPKDQRTVEERPDVLVFSSAPLTEPIEVAGRVRVRLWAASTQPDTDFFARLCDVYPDGRSYNICEGQVRARFRKSFDKETFLKPDRPYPFEIDLASTAIIFNRGHRLRVQVTSSSFPGFDPNPNTGEPFRASARNCPATNTVFLDAHRPSHLELPVVDPGRPH